MAYKVINEFIDTTTSTHYKKGDVYPAEGLSLNPELVASLMKRHAKYKRVFIEEVKEKVNKPTNRKATAKKNEK